jgi:HK97 gp10 family phage protein
MALSRAQVRSQAASMDWDSSSFMRSLVRKVAALEVTTEAALWVWALRVQNHARVLAPVDTGRLRSSIMASKGAGFVQIGTNVEYAIHVEFGTKYMAAQPYLRPAIAIAVGEWPTVAKGASVG